VSPDRRTVLKGLAAGGVVVVGGAFVAQQVRDDDAPAPPATTAPPPPEPRSTMGDALVAVGIRYLEDVPEEADQAFLLEQLPALEGTVPERPGPMLGVLAPQAVADHTIGDLVELDGWVLSRTEARAAALYAL
jgi:hypothetical protein